MTCTSWPISPTTCLWQPPTRSRFLHELLAPTSQKKPMFALMWNREDFSGATSQVAGADGGEWRQWRRITGQLGWGDAELKNEANDRTIMLFPRSLWGYAPFLQSQGKYAEIISVRWILASRRHHIRNLQAHIILSVWYHLQLITLLPANGWPRIYKP